MRGYGTVEVEQENMVVVHDPAGKIVHVHHVVTFKGGAHPDQATRERDALDQMVTRRPALAKKKVAYLHVDPRSFDGATGFKVDVKKRTLVEVKARKR
jgi:hypothetical protein